MTESSVACALTDLRVKLRTGEPIVEDVSISVARGEIVGLVGESGSGKSTTGLSILGYTNRGAEVEGGGLMVAGEALPLTDESRMARGRLMTYVPQNPGTALNPSMRVGRAIADMLTTHRPDLLAPGAVGRLLETVGLPGTPSFADRFPHQLSGGQQQRVCIAIAISCEPALVVLDEPTTGLDVVTERHILEALVRLNNERHMAMLYITHDLSVIAQIADRVVVMYAGRVVEEGSTEAVLRSPRHPYTRGLIACVPDHANPRPIRAMPGVAVGIGDRGPGCAFAPRCSQRIDVCFETVPPRERVTDAHTVRCYTWTNTPAATGTQVQAGRQAAGDALPTVLEVRNLRAEHRSRAETVLAAADVSFSLRRGETVALVGESGSGKSTIARAIVGLHAISSGQVLLAGESLAALAHRRTLEQRRRVQLVFQDSSDALNPRHTVRSSIARPARTLRGLRDGQLSREVAHLLERVRLPARLAERYPAELSGGERQRVAIARALAAQPDVVVCDEVTSALDVSVQAAVVELLEDLRREFGLSLVFITHDLSVVRLIADQVLVLQNGVVCEQGETAELLDRPRHPYTRRLLAAAPSLSMTISSWSGSSVQRGGNSYASRR